MATQTSTIQQGNLFASRSAAGTPTSTPPQPTERTRPYKDFLTPSLHRRFSSAATLVFIACYLTALLISPPRLLWIWNPISFHGARAFVLFISCLMVFIIRVANLHVGKRLTTSGAETVYQALTSPRTLHTAAWYVLGAFVFGEVYLWSRDEGANLGWIDHGSPWERSRVNENPLFLRAVWFCVALGQTGIHVARGEDAVAVPLERKTEGEAAAPEGKRLPANVYELQKRVPEMARRALVLALPGFAATMVLYFVLLRRIMWPFFHRMAQIFYSDLATESHAVGVQIDRIPRLTWQSFSSAFLLATLWQLSNACFSIHMSEPPTKKDEPLTSEIKDNTGAIVVKSKDPNGSLLNGLQHKKEVNKAFALWELAMICADFPMRRKTLYLEVDRKDGSTWSQTSKVCLDELTAISTRIKIALDPEKAQKEHDEKILLQQQQKGLIAGTPEQPLGLPKIANRGVAQYSDIYQQRASQDIAHQVGDVVKSFGQSTGAQNPMLPRARKAIEWGADRTLTQSQRQELTRQGLQQRATTTFDRLLATEAGKPFRQTFTRRAAAVVFGVPVSNKVNIIHAARSLSDLCTHAIQEDDYGQVAKSVRSILVTFTKTIKDINTLLATLKPAKSDVLFQEGDRQVTELEKVKTVLKEGLEKVLLAYGEYADSVGFTKTEVREAREALGKGREMGQR